MKTFDLLFYWSSTYLLLKVASTYVLTKTRVRTSADLVNRSRRIQLKGLSAENYVGKQ